MAGHCGGVSPLRNERRDVKAERKQPFESSSEDEVCVPLMIILIIEAT
jgi:hypothetical protein